MKPPATSSPSQPAAAATSKGPRKQKQQKQQQKPEGGAAEAAQQREFVTDSILYAGAPVWALDWCPWPRGRPLPGPSEACDLLALSTHPKGLPRTRVGAQQRGPGTLQLWAVPHSAPAAAAAGGGGGASTSSAGQPSTSAAGVAAEEAATPAAGAAAALPRCLALLCHDGKLAWDLKWCPDASAFIRGGEAALASGTLGSSAAAAAQGSGGASSSGSSSSEQQPIELQGLLAAVLGDGSVQLYVVPAMHQLAAMGAAAKAGATPGSGAAAGEAAGAGVAAGEKLHSPMRPPSGGTEARRQQQQQEGGGNGEEGGTAAATGGEGAAAATGVAAGGGTGDEGVAHAVLPMAPPAGAAEGVGSGGADAPVTLDTAAAAGCAILDLRPAAIVSTGMLGGSLASCCCWSPEAPHHYLLIGCWDGHVAMCRLPTAASGGALGTA